jgi:hypothetical protein
LRRQRHAWQAFLASVTQEQARAQTALIEASEVAAIEGYRDTKLLR